LELKSNLQSTLEAVKIIHDNKYSK